MKKIALASAAALALLGSGTANAAVKDNPSFQVGGLVIVWGSDGTNQNVVSDFNILTSSGNAAADLINGDIDGTGTAVVTGAFDPISGALNPDGTAATNPEAFSDANSDGVLDAGDSFSAFGIDANTDIDGLGGSSTGRFHVASNTAFDIMATVEDVTPAGEAGDFDLGNIQWTGSVVTSGAASNGSLAFGTAAQHPGGAAGGTAGISAAAKLDAFAAPGAATQTQVFDGARRTAASVGTIAAQSVQFVNSYAFGQDVTSGGTTSFVEGYDLAMGAGRVDAEVTYTVFAP